MSTTISEVACSENENRGCNWTAIWEACCSPIFLIVADMTIRQCRAIADAAIKAV